MKNAPWYIGTMNDGYFVIDKPPHPVPVDYLTPGDPDTKVIAALGTNGDAARLLVSEHNAKIALVEALEMINAKACYGSEEDTSASTREAVLLYIGEHARAALALAKGENNVG